MSSTNQLIETTMVRKEFDENVKFNHTMSASGVYRQIHETATQENWFDHQVHLTYLGAAEDRDPMPTDLICIKQIVLGDDSSVNGDMRILDFAPTGFLWFAEDCSSLRSAGKFCVPKGATYVAGCLAPVHKSILEPVCDTTVTTLSPPVTLPIPELDTSYKRDFTLDNEKFTVTVVAFQDPKIHFTEDEAMKHCWEEENKKTLLTLSGHEEMLSELSTKMLEYAGWGASYSVDSTSVFKLSVNLVSKTPFWRTFFGSALHGKPVNTGKLGYSNGHPVSGKFCGAWNLENKLVSVDCDEKEDNEIGFLCGSLSYDSNPMVIGEDLVYVDLQFV